MFSLISLITTAILATIGSISIGVWATLAVQYLTGKENPEKIKNSHLQERLSEARKTLSDVLNTSENETQSLKEEIRALREKYDDQQTLVITKLLGK